MLSDTSIASMIVDRAHGSGTRAIGRAAASSSSAQRQQQQRRRHMPPPRCARPPRARRPGCCSAAPACRAGAAATGRAPAAGAAPASARGTGATGRSWSAANRAAPVRHVGCCGWRAEPALQRHARQRLILGQAEGACDDRASGVASVVASAPRAGAAMRPASGVLAIAQVEAVELHHLHPRGDEVAHEVRPRHRWRRTPRTARAAVRSSRRPGRPGSPSSAVRRSRGRGLRTRRASAFRLLPGGAHVQQVAEEVGRERAGAIGEHAVRRARRCWHRVRAGRPRSTVISGAVSVSRLAWSISALATWSSAPGLHVVAEAVGRRLEHANEFDIGLLQRGVHAARRERHGDIVAGRARRGFDRRAAAEHDQVGQRDPLAAGLARR